MDEKSQEIFDSIIAKSPSELNEIEIKFLRARRDYLKDSQKEEYKSVLKTKPPAKETVKKNAKKEN